MKIVIRSRSNGLGNPGGPAAEEGVELDIDLAVFIKALTLEHSGLTQSEPSNIGFQSKSTLLFAVLEVVGIADLPRGDQRVGIPDTVQVGVEQSALSGFDHGGVSRHVRLVVLNEELLAGSRCRMAERTHGNGQNGGEKFGEVHFGCLRGVLCDRWAGYEEERGPQSMLLDVYDIVELCDFKLRYCQDCILVQNLLKISVGRERFC